MLSAPPGREREGSLTCQRKLLCLIAVLWFLALLFDPGTSRAIAASRSIYPWEQLVAQYQKSSVPEHRLILATAYANL